MFLCMHAHIHECVPDPCRGPAPEGDKSGRGSEAAARALLGRGLETEVYSKFEYYIGPEGAYGGVPPSCGKST